MGSNAIETTFFWRKPTVSGALLGTCRSQVDQYPSGCMSADCVLADIVESDKLATAI